MIGIYKYYKAVFYNHRPGRRPCIVFDVYSKNSSMELDHMIESDMKNIELVPNEDYIIEKGKHIRLRVMNRRAAIKVLNYSEYAIAGEKVRDCLSIINFFNIMCSNSGVTNIDSDEDFNTVLGLCGLPPIPSIYDRPKNPANLHFEYLLANMTYDLNSKSAIAYFEFFKTADFDDCIADVKQDMDKLSLDGGKDWVLVCEDEPTQIHTLEIHNLSAALKLIKSSYSEWKDVETDCERVTAFFDTSKQSIFW